LRENNAITTAPRISREALRPPKAAAAAGIVFSILLILSLTILRIAAPPATSPAEAWLSNPSMRRALRFALHLVPFAGVAFLWFMGVLRNRLGSREDQFFATVFLASGLLFITSLFAATALAGAFVGERPAILAPSAYELGRLAAHGFMNIFAVKMAAVFMFSTSTIALRTSIFPRWAAYSGFACALVLLLIITSWPWITLLFPLWILVLSVYVLISDLRFESERLPDD
jgi:hypothetical protein